MAGPDPLQPPPSLVEAESAAILRGTALAVAVWEVDRGNGAARLREADQSARLLLSGDTGQDGFPPGLDPAAAVFAALAKGEPTTLGLVESAALGQRLKLVVRAIPLEAGRVALVWLEAVSEGELAGALDTVRAEASALARDFNNFLQAVDGNIELAQLGASVAERLEAVAAAAVRARDLSGQLEALGSAMGAGGSPVELGALVSELGPALQAEAPAGVEVVCDIRGRGARVAGAARSLRRVLRGLVQGAVEARAGGQVRVSVGECRVVRGEGGWLGGAPAPGDYGYIEITDDGPGVAEPPSKSLYAAAAHGRGQSVTLAVSVAAAFGGGVQVGPRTRVRLVLPLLAPTEPLSLPAEAVATVVGTVLVVDDDEAVRELLRTTLERQGYVVATADDEEAGLDLFQHLNDHGGLDCVILDLSMVPARGPTALRAMRVFSDRVPVIVTSGHTPAEVARQFGDCPPDAVLRKPAPLATVLDQVRQAVELRRR